MLHSRYYPDPVISQLKYSTINSMTRTHLTTHQEYLQQFKKTSIIMIWPHSFAGYSNL